MMNRFNNSFSKNGRRLVIERELYFIKNNALYLPLTYKVYEQDGSITSYSQRDYSEKEWIELGVQLKKEFSGDSNE